MKRLTLTLAMLLIPALASADSFVQLDTVIIKVKRAKTLDEKGKDILKMMGLMHKHSNSIITYGKLQKDLVPIVASYKLIDSTNKLANK